MKLKQLPIGAKVRDAENEIVFLVAAQDHPGYGGTTLLAERVIGVRCFDAAEPDRPRRKVFELECDFGSNNYKTSNIHQWLNSDKAQWYEKKHPLDCPPDAAHTLYHEQPYEKTPGFLSGFSQSFRDHILESTVPVLERVDCGKAKLTNVRAKVFLPSRTELVKGNECGIAEGFPLPLLYDHKIFKALPLESEMEKHGRSWNPGRETAPYDAPQIYDPKFGWWYWMRTPNYQYSFLLRVASAYGAVSYTHASNDVVGVRPMLNMDEDTEVKGDGAIDETFTIC